MSIYVAEFVEGEDQTKDSFVLIQELEGCTTVKEAKKAIDPVEFEEGKKFQFVKVVGGFSTEKIEKTKVTFS